MPGGFCGRLPVVQFATEGKSDEEEREEEPAAHHPSAAPGGYTASGDPPAQAERVIYFILPPAPLTRDRELGVVGKPAG